MGLFDFFKKEQRSIEPTMYVVDAMNGNVIMVAEQVQYPVYNQLQKEALQEFKKNSAFVSFYEKFNSNAKQCNESVRSSPSKANVNIFEDPIRLLSAQTGLSYDKLLRLNGTRLFMYKVNYTLSPYGQPFPAECSLTYFFQGDIA